MRYLIALSALAISLVAATSASAGGWATVGLSSLPDGMSAGDPWEPDITILQHGRTPLEGLSPTVTITEAEGLSETFTARATDEPGVYEVSVVFPVDGQWTIVVDSTFGESRLTYGPVSIGAPTSTPGSFPTMPVVVAVVLGGLALLAGFLGFWRQRRLSPAGP